MKYCIIVKYKKIQVKVLIEMEINEKEFSIKFNDNKVKQKYINVFTMELLEMFKPHIINFAKKCKDNKIYEIDMYGNHTLTVYDHIHLENIIVILQKGTIRNQHQTQSHQLTDEEIKNLNDSVKGVYD